MDLSPSKWFVACWMVDDKISMHKIIFLPIVISFHWEQSVMPPSPDVRARDTFQLFKWVPPFKGFLCKCCCSTKERKMLTISASNLIWKALNWTIPIQLLSVLMCWEYQLSTSCSCWLTWWIPALSLSGLITAGSDLNLHLVMLYWGDQNESLSLWYFMIRRYYPDHCTVVIV